jgi:hypothetical protein
MNTYRDLRDAHKRPQSFHPPWMPRLHRAEKRGVEPPPATLPQIATSQIISGIDETVAPILQFSARELTSRWRKNWKSVLAVGPFAPSQRPRDSIQFVLYGDIRSLNANLEHISQALAATYSEFEILPDVYVFHERYVDTLLNEDNRNWTLTRKYSVAIGQQYD